MRAARDELRRTADELERAKELLKLADAGALREARDDLSLFKFLSLHAADAQVLLDHEGNVEYVNEAAARLLGRDVHGLAGKPWRELVDFDLGRLIEMACATQAEREEVVIPDLELGPRTAEISAKTVQFRGRRYCFVSLRDVTARKISERRLHVEHAVAAALVEARSIEDGLTRVLEEFICGFELFVAELWVAREGELVLAAQRYGASGNDVEHWRAASADSRVTDGAGLIGRVWTERRALWIDDLAAQTDLLRYRDARAIGMRTAFGLPIVDEGECVAVLAFFARSAIAAEDDLLNVLESVRRGLEQFVLRDRVERTLWLRNRAIEETREGIVMSDARLADQPIVYVNRGFELLTGYARDEVLGRNCRFLQGPETDPQARAQLRAAIAARQEARVTILNYAKNGRPFWNDVELSPVRDETGAVTHFVGVMHDVSELKSIEGELRHAHVLAQAASQAKSEFLANVSHEIRTPLSTILGFCDIVLGGVGDPAVSDDVRAIRRNAAYLAELIEDILDLSRIEAGKLRIESEAFALAELVLDLDALMQVRAQERGVAFAFEFTTDVPLIVRTDRVRVRQILINLIGNALKFTDHGGVRVEIALLDDLVQPQIEFCVVDSGPGIAADDFERIFEPFTQVASTAQRHRSGAGLGLTISRRLAGELGGTIDVASQLGVGSRFTLRLPIGSLADAPISRPSLHAPVLGSQRASTLAGEFTGCRALVIDDIAEVRRVVAHFLELGGAQVVGVGDGAEALREFERANDDGRPFDVILIDIQLPDRTGDEWVAELRSRGFDQPVLAITASAMKDECEQWLQAGCDEVIAKPIDGVALVRTVAGHLARHARSRRGEGDDGSAAEPAPVEVLVVEDDVDAAESTRRLLQARGAWVRVAHSGREALDAYRERPPELALLDLRLQDVDGFALVELLIAQRREPRPLFVAVSGLSDPRDDERARTAGFDLKLVKPVEPDRLFELVGRALERRGARP